MQCCYHQYKYQYTTNPIHKVIPSLKLQLSGKYPHRIVCVCDCNESPVFSDDELGKISGYIQVHIVLPALFYPNRLINSHFNLFS
jgi:hypothetical protein